MCVRFYPSGVRLAAVSVGAALALAASAQAAGEPVAYADAQAGTLRITSGVVVSPTAVDLRGVWQDTKLPCSAQRKLAVRAVVHFTPPGGVSRRVVLSRTFKDVNCAEGGPNVGFTPTARTLVMACPNGVWKPGAYEFDTGTTDTVGKLKATASLNWTKTARC